MCGETNRQFSLVAVCDVSCCIMVCCLRKEIQFEQLAGCFPSLASNSLQEIISCEAFKNDLLYQQYIS